MLTEKDYIEKTSNEFLKWNGYCEKRYASDVANATYDNPGGYTDKAGSANYTVFAKVYYEKTGINVQGQPWCDSFVDTIFIHLYGVDMAKKLLGGFSAYTPTSAQYFKNMGRWVTTNPQEGDIIFFKNSTRICHTGYNYDYIPPTVYTVEGNTSAGNNTVVPNGGQVAKKSYTVTNSRIAGYGRPDYSLLVKAQPKPESYYQGWLKAADGVRWWYQFADGSYASNNGKNNGWYAIDGYWYLFDDKGYMLTDVQYCKTKSGEGYYLFWPFHDSNEGKCMITDSNGKLDFLKA